MNALSRSKFVYHNFGSYYSCDHWCVRLKDIRLYYQFMGKEDRFFSKFARGQRVMPVSPTGEGVCVARVRSSFKNWMIGPVTILY